MPDVVVRWVSGSVSLDSEEVPFLVDALRDVSPESFASQNAEAVAEATTEGLVRARVLACSNSGLFKSEADFNAFLALIDASAAEVEAQRPH